MLRSPTTFIIGAGASCEVRLPSGNDLKRQIVGLLDIRFSHHEQKFGDYAIMDAFRQWQKEKPEDIKDLNVLLHKSWQIRDGLPAGAISIDNYLDAHAGDQLLEMCGKLAIAKAIIQAEEKSLLAPILKVNYPPKPFDMDAISNTWFASLMKLLNEGIRRDNVDNIFKNVSFIVFNYDRCLEVVLLRLLTDYYGLDYTEAHKVLGRATIIHPYGTVGELPSPGGRDGLGFGQTQNLNLLECGRRIKTFTEKIDDKDQLNAIRGAVSDAHHLIFLGFAYHRQNMELIRPTENGQIRRVFGTAMGISGYDSALISEDMQVDYRRKNDLTPRVSFVHDVCSKLFEDHWRGITS